MDPGLDLPWVQVAAVVGIPVVIIAGKKIRNHVSLPYFSYKHLGNVDEAIKKFESDIKDSSGEDPRKQFYASTVQTYYNLVTDFYEYGWGTSFHFAPRLKDESFENSIVRYEHRVAACLGLHGRIPNGLADKPHILDVGCGVGGPMRTIARFFNFEVRITGINITPEHIARAKRHNERQRIQNCDFIQTDFNQIPIPDNSVDGLYDFEALCHSSDLARTFRELYRVLKPGGRFVSAQYCVTGKWDPKNSTHVDVMRRFDNIIGTFCAGRTPEFVLAALQDTGFRILSAEDIFLPDANNEIPYGCAFDDLPSASRLAINSIWAFVRVMETVRLAPKGTTQVYEMLIESANLYKEAYKYDIFTPGFLFVVEKPLC